MIPSWALPELPHTWQAFVALVGTYTVAYACTTKQLAISKYVCIYIYTQHVYFANVQIYIEEYISEYCMCIHICVHIYNLLVYFATYLLYSCHSFVLLLVHDGAFFFVCIFVLMCSMAHASFDVTRQLLAAKADAAEQSNFLGLSETKDAKRKTNVTTYTKNVCTYIYMYT